jgi:hypothetical protein
VFEAGASSTLFSWENCVSFGKEYFLKPQTIKLAIGSVCSKKAYSPDLKKHMYLSKEKHL